VTDEIFYIFYIQKLLYTFYTDMEEAFAAVCWDGRKDQHKGKGNTFTSLTRQEKTGHKT